MAAAQGMWAQRATHLPALQAVHTEAPPALAVKRPLGQLLQADVPLKAAKKPAAQALQADAPSPDEKPGAQAVHTVDALAPA